MYNILHSVKFLRGSIFMDGWSLPFHRFNFCECVYSQLYSWAYFASLIFTVSGSSMKTVENWTPILYLNHFLILRGSIFAFFADDHLTMKITLAKKFDCTVHGRECVCPWKVNPQNGGDRPYANNEPRENFPLYNNILFLQLILYHSGGIMCWVPCVYVLSPEPTLTVGKVVGVLENVAVERRKEVWSRRGIVPRPQLEEIYQKYSTEEQRIHACADIFVNCCPRFSWTHLCRGLYRENETTAARKAKTFIPQTGEQ